jgi:hypothetical protein
MGWSEKIYVAAIVGGVLAALWPDIIRLVRPTQPVPLTDLLPNRAARLVVLLVAGVIVGVIAAAILFVVFLGSTTRIAGQRFDQEDALRYAGKASYFLAFTAGFAAMSFLSEPFKRS